MLPTRFGKIVAPVKRGPNPRRSVPRIVRGDNKSLYLDHPQYEEFEVRQTVGRGKAG
jgi:hypothetical protein